MEPWLVPILVAVIAAIPALMGILASRRASKADTHVRETELAVNGLATLVRELREEREDCREELQRVRERLALVEIELGLREEAHGRR